MDKYKNECIECEGSGYEPLGGDISPCRSCLGSGWDCPACGGSGYDIGFGGQIHDCPMCANLTATPSDLRRKEKRERIKAGVLLLAKRTVQPMGVLQLFKSSLSLPPSSW